MTYKCCSRFIGHIGMWAIFAAVVVQVRAAEPVHLHVDAREAPKRILHAKMIMPVKPGPLTLLYPKWIPGEHGPTGPVANIAGLKIVPLTPSPLPHGERGDEFSNPVVGGERGLIPWKRDELDMYAFNCTVPEGVDKIEVSLDFLSAAGSGGFTAGSNSTPQLAVINWNQVVLYPKGRAASEITYQPSLTLPKGWRLGTALHTESQTDSRTTFKPVSLETLVDSPLVCGAYYREIQLALRPKLRGLSAPHYISMVCDSPGGLEYAPEWKEACDRLVKESHLLFGSLHYNSYRFLITLSDRVPHFGLEHHESSDNRVMERGLVDADLRKSWATLLPHELIHSWNGKYRRPADMVGRDFHEPLRTKMLWVYEGLTQYLTCVLVARSGLLSMEEARDLLAIKAQGMQNQRGRSWRPLEDTAVSAQLLFGTPSGWRSWRRYVDFYDEGVLIWLEMDMMIREQTKGRKSLDDFCRLFFGGKSGGPEVKPFTLEDLVNALNEVSPYDWAAHIENRLGATAETAPLGGLTRSGWKLAFAEQPTKLQDIFEGLTTRRGGANFTASIGFKVSRDAQIIDVVPDSPAAIAGVPPGGKLVAVNSRRWSPSVMKAALADGKKSKQPLELLVENGDFFTTYMLDYHDGNRYPRLERIMGREDVLSRILSRLGG